MQVALVKLELALSLNPEQSSQNNRLNDFFSLCSQHQISFHEVSHHSKGNHVQIGLAVVGDDAVNINERLEHVLNAIRKQDELDIVDCVQQLIEY